jgi:hypothetical protein
MDLRTQEELTDKCIKVIRSCTQYDQLEAARRYCKLACRYLPDDMERIFRDYSYIVESRNDINDARWE